MSARRTSGAADVQVPVGGSKLPCEMAEQTFGTCASNWFMVHSFARSLGKLRS